MDRELYDDTFDAYLAVLDPNNLGTPEEKAKIEHLRLFSEIKRPQPEEDLPCEPPTGFKKMLHGAAAVLDNETVRVTIKAGLGFAGVWWVGRATINRDHVLEKQALDQANRMMR